jgi:predicted enzyme related to lactoylglutathione lyase
MITGAHAIIYSSEADEVRAFLRDKLELSGLDIGGGWQIFAMPPTELAVHPTDGDPSSEANGRVELYLQCDDINATVKELESKGVTVTGPVSEQAWGLLTGVRLPGGAEIGLYEPRHPTAHG